ncbi:MAG: radical SAM protein [Verrucomicrobiales bacterium]
MPVNSGTSTGRTVPFFPTAELLRAGGRSQEELSELARQTRKEHFRNSVFIRGVVEISNYCRQNCNYCGMRRDNKELERFRTDFKRLAELIIHQRPLSITDINIQAGEDPVAVREAVIPLVRILRQETNLGISVCLGNLSNKLYAELKEAGASIYILKFETGDAEHYRAMQSPGGSLQTRVEHIQHLAATGWKVSSGFIAGLPGQQDKELLENFHLAAKLPLEGCSVSPFIPGDETPTSEAEAASIDLTLNCMAALRLMRPEWVIPAVSALNLADPAHGYRKGWRTGANLATINLTPSDVREDYLLYKRERFIMTEERILTALTAEGLVPSKVGLATYYQNKTTAQLSAA